MDKQGSTLNYRVALAGGHGIVNTIDNLYTLLIHTPPFFEKRFSHSNLFVHGIIILLFVQQKYKHEEMMFLTSTNASKHIVLALSVTCTDRDAVKAKFTRVPISCRKLHLVEQSLTRRQTNAVEFATKVCFSLFDGLEVFV